MSTRRAAQWTDKRELFLCTTGCFFSLLSGLQQKSQLLQKYLTVVFNTSHDEILESLSWLISGVKQKNKLVKKVYITIVELIY